ncbi:MAG TPA: c-type cytochrome [Methyloceanibacter sp.]|nr:c-type cytochrome [Methyloceanibacter sp.]
MHKITTGILTIVIVAGMGAFAWKACATDEPAQQAVPATPAAEPAAPAAGAAPAGEAAPADAAAPAAAGGGECCKPGDTTPPLDLIKATPKGGLHNPYNDKIAEMTDEGHKKYLSFSCNGCHGGGGGGGMCVPLTNDTWVYGPDDDTLFRLVALGSVDLSKAGYKRVKSEVVVGPMPPFGGIIKTSDDLWKVIAWMRSVNPGSEKKPPLQ